MTAATVPALQIRNARKAFGGHEVLRGIDLDVAAGEVVAIIGPSGSGKSTLLRAIPQLEPLDLGYVRAAGELVGVREQGGRLRRLPDRAVRAQRSAIGFVFQSFNLFGHLTVVDNVAEPLLAHRAADRATARRRAGELLTRVGIGEKADAYPRQLSGGQQQRAAIARALALDPQLLLFDEPTSALDPELVGEVLAVIRELADSGRTLVIVTHELRFAREIADTVHFLDRGLVVESGPPSQVIDNPSHERTRAFVSRVR